MKILIASIVLLVLIAFALLFGPELAARHTYNYRLRLIEQTKKLSARVKADSRDTNALNSLIALLKSKDSWTRGQAANALSAVGTKVLFTSGKVSVTMTVPRVGPAPALSLTVMV